MYVCKYGQVCLDYYPIFVVYTNRVIWFYLICTLLKCIICKQRCFWRYSFTIAFTYIRLFTDWISFVYKKNTKRIGGQQFKYRNLLHFNGLPAFCWIIVSLTDFLCFYLFHFFKSIPNDIFVNRFRCILMCSEKNIH